MKKAHHMIFWGFLALLFTMRTLTIESETWWTADRIIGLITYVIFSGIFFFMPTKSE